MNLLAGPIWVIPQKVFLDSFTVPRVGAAGAHRRGDGALGSPRTQGTAVKLPATPPRPAKKQSTLPWAPAKSAGAKGGSAANKPRR